VAGWDEAFLAVDTGDPEACARDIQQRVRAATGLACTIGIGENKLQAKLAAGFGKPAGVFRLTHGNWLAVMGDRPTDALWGIGAKTAQRLAGLGIGTVAELAATDPRELAAQLGPVTGPWLVQTARGLGPARVEPAPYVPRSHGREVTFQQDLTDWEQVRQEVARLARQVAAEIAGQRPAARVEVKVRYVPFFTRIHGRKLPAATSDSAVIEQAALAVLGQFTSHRPVRLVGVRAEFPR
jgi:DNA polymerase-4